MNKNWIEQSDVWRRLYAPLTWVPLYLNRETDAGGRNQIGQYKDIEAVRTVAIYTEKKAELDGVGFVDLPHHHGPSTWIGYTPTDVRRSNSEGDLGIYLFLNQSFDGEAPSFMTLNQDFVFALGLAKEGDAWVRPSEGYIDVAKFERDVDGEVNALLVRPEYLRDYLAARSMSLLIGSYRERRWVVSDVSQLGYAEDQNDEVVDAFGRHSFYVRAITSDGFPYGGGVAVFTASRTDQWADDEVPMLGPETDDNTLSSSTTFTREGEKRYSVMSERRFSEWIDPAALSPRVRNDDVPSTCNFLVDAQGTASNADDLNREEVGLWLYFRPSVIPEILSRRGGSIEWYTRFTAGIYLTGGMPIHFGINGANLVVAYAHDIARQAEWQRRIWAAHNVAPEGGLGEELDAAQVRTKPANTQAPEDFIIRAQEVVNDAFVQRWGVPLFRTHQDTNEIALRTHRFRSLDRNGFLSLAKDLARLSADLIDTKTLHTIAPAQNGQGTGSLRSLERALATLMDAGEARGMTSKLAGIYELRLGDAHLPSEKLDEALSLARVPSEGSWLFKGMCIIDAYVSSLYEIAGAVAPR